MTYHEASKTSQTEARATSDWTPTLARIEQLAAEVERLRAEQAEFRRKIEAMPNTIISRRAKRHVLAALGGERDE